MTFRITIAICALAGLGCAGEITFSDEMGGEQLHSPLMQGTELNFNVHAPGRELKGATLSSTNFNVVEAGLDNSCFFGCSEASGRLISGVAGDAELVLRDGRAEAIARVPIEVVRPDDVQLVRIGDEARARDGDNLTLHLGGEVSFLVDARHETREVFGVGDLQLLSTDRSVVNASVFRSSKDPARAFATVVATGVGGAQLNAAVDGNVIATFEINVNESVPRDIALERRGAVLSAVVVDDANNVLGGATPVWLIDGIVINHSSPDLSLLPAPNASFDVEACIRGVDDEQLCARRVINGARFEPEVANVGTAPADLPPTGRGCTAAPWEAPALALASLVVLGLRRRRS